MTQITVTFDKPKNAPGVCDALHTFKQDVEMWHDDALEDGREDCAEVWQDLSELLERLIGNLQGV